MPGIGFNELRSGGAKLLSCRREGRGGEIHTDVSHIAPQDVPQQGAFATAKIQDSLMWPKPSRGHEGLITSRAVLHAKLLEETKPLTSKAAMPVFQIHVRGVHHAVLSQNEGGRAPLLWRVPCVRFASAS